MSIRYSAVIVILEDYCSAIEGLPFIVKMVPVNVVCAKEKREVKTKKKREISLSKLFMIDKIR